MTTFDPQHVFDTLTSKAQALGVYETVNGHEPHSAPHNGVHLAFWADYLGPAPMGSGLAATTGLLIVNARSYLSMNAQPADGIDPALLRAAWALHNAIHGDFDLGILDADGDPAAWVDLLGQTRSRLETRAGYLGQDDTAIRVMNTVIPIVITDLWTQTQ